MKTSITMTLAVLMLSAGAVQAADQQRDRDRIHNPAAATQAQQQEQVYGSELMTPEERAAHRAKMRAAKTAAEREAIRLQHHKEMQVRAKQQGLILPDTPPAQGGGMGPGQGMGSGRGQGMGQGGGQP